MKFIYVLPFLLSVAVGVAIAGTSEINNAGKGSRPILNSRTACTVTASASANMTFKSVFCSRSADMLRVEGEAAFTGAPGVGAVWRIQIPTGNVIDTAKLANGSTTSAGEASSAGFCTAWDDADAGYRVICPVIYDTSGTQNQVKFVVGGGDLLDDAIANNDSINFKIEVPIVGW